MFKNIIILMFITLFLATPILAEVDTSDVVVPVLQPTQGHQDTTQQIEARQTTANILVLISFIISITIGIFLTVWTNKKIFKKWKYTITLPLGWAAAMILFFLLLLPIPTITGIVADLGFALLIFGIFWGGLIGVGVLAIIGLIVDIIKKKK